MKDLPKTQNCMMAPLFKTLNLYRRPSHHSGMLTICVTNFYLQKNLTFRIWVPGLYFQTMTMYLSAGIMVHGQAELHPISIRSINPGLLTCFEVGGVLI